MPSDDAAVHIRALLEAEAARAPRPAGMTAENLRRARRGRAATVVTSLFSVLLVASAVGLAATSIDNQRVEQFSLRGPFIDSTSSATGDCPLTIPPEDGFVPPQPYPAEAPMAMYEAEWYGTAGLWTMLDAEGVVWEDLPESEGDLVNKTTWWSDGYPAEEQPAPPITVRGRRLDGPGSFKAGGPAGGGHRQDVGDFIIVGIGIPSPGCWELTARYRGAELTYVVLVKE